MSTGLLYKDLTLKSLDCNRNSIHFFSTSLCIKDTITAHQTYNSEYIQYVMEEVVLENSLMPYKQ
jgi:hypothetical protein